MFKGFVARCSLGYRRTFEPPPPKKYEKKLCKISLRKSRSQHQKPLKNTSKHPKTTRTYPKNTTNYIGSLIQNLSKHRWGLTYPKTIKNLNQTYQNYHQNPTKTLPLQTDSPPSSHVRHRLRTSMGPKRGSFTPPSTSTSPRANSSVRSLLVAN